MGGQVIRFCNENNKHEIGAAMSEYGAIGSVGSNDFVRPGGQNPIAPLSKLGLVPNLARGLNNNIEVDLEMSIPKITTRQRQKEEQDHHHGG